MMTNIFFYIYIYEKWISLNMNYFNILTSNTTQFINLIAFLKVAFLIVLNFVKINI